jgi:hypothetical protein
LHNQPLLWTGPRRVVTLFLIQTFLGASRCPPQNVIRYPAMALPTIDIPVVDRWPEFPPRHPPIADICDYLITRLLTSEARLLYADYGKHGGKWFVQKRLDDPPCTDDVVAEVPDKSFFRMILARFGSHHLEGQLYGGYVEAFYKQREKSQFVAIYMGNDTCRGFWLRAYTRAG